VFSSLAPLLNAVWNCGCSKKLLDQEEVSQVLPADQERGFTPEDVKLIKIQFSSCNNKLDSNLSPL